jgi:hypothetical protein
MTLLYVGISPKAPPKAGGRPSKQNLRTRIRTHYRGNASGSTLRLSLGCLFAETLMIELRRHGKSERRHFGKEGEETDPASVLIPTREAMNTALADLLRRRPNQARAQNLKDKVLSIGTQAKRDEVDPDQLTTLADEAEQIIDSLSGARQRVMPREEVRALFTSCRRSGSAGSLALTKRSLSAVANSPPMTSGHATMDHPLAGSLGSTQCYRSTLVCETRWPGISGRQASLRPTGW